VPIELAAHTEAGGRLLTAAERLAETLAAHAPQHDRDGVERYAYAMVPTCAPGVVVHDDWDALGMRASGSNSVSFEGVAVPESGVRGGFRAGDPVPYIERNLLAGLFHAAASLGIAESVDAIARRGIAGRINADARQRMQVADNAVDLVAARGALSRAASLIDDHRAANPASDGIAEDLTALFAEAQAAKAFVNEAAARVVGRPRACPVRWRRLRQRQPARARVPRRQGRLIHAPARRQPHVRLPRSRRAWGTGIAALKWGSPLRQAAMSCSTHASSATHSAGSRPASPWSRRRSTASRSA
jgi:hypothetical protein